uniref:Yippee domain-containing protein n=1 Tax=Entomoneis paludosa TaxID=265537 RepID=A0A7S2V7S0_9STRA|mmetsp:Transcript_10535/g.21671  ORF Transcript_10535/g.21671 Transcript_10535/m.21671 type:complete len:395 (+) Transcript_10535:527-1711(+)|eukprot:CAMPEP_0172457540 /NCGR_PEP_ID=MMETSP1065-20121228/22706_1 /TAXON_ID=265537 /ORGANISM="Amphiprora paludosa, Strain CCMP125" /LENGTH=394 /DNA_ID=CAMNT_0013211341 /DNA_START=458 /DNA_END=1642 /DNA_ORIENTATION=+
MSATTAAVSVPPTGTNNNSANSTGQLHHSPQPPHHGTQPTYASPRNGASSAPLRHERAPIGHGQALALQHGRSLNSSSGLLAVSPPLSSTTSVLLLPPTNNNMHRGSIPDRPVALPASPSHAAGLPSPLLPSRRLRSASLGRAMSLGAAHNPFPRSNSVAAALSPRFLMRQTKLVGHPKNLVSEATAKAQTKSALKVNDSMVYLEGPQVYACQQCRTHLTSHDDIVSKSFQGRHGRAFLLDGAVNLTIGPPEDRTLMTGLHSVCDIFCKRCKTLVGWTYQKAYEPSQKYKEGKFIIEKINLYLEVEQSSYNVALTASPISGPARKQRSQSWGQERAARRRQEHHPSTIPPSPPLTARGTPESPSHSSMVYEYPPSSVPSSLGSNSSNVTNIMSL